ncbi:putative ubiquitin-conjugating enzyme E2 38 [Impatiens glandulifera]|uniref:putative ubiquitin-conjugating enzyme E2 38 n=1 Tax=Impatiens glandulifera TaxID=253017 RepID=UPI001FB1930A|nr:putative ubiquitin-conjugating enzyme E2 38 [Impatiens glandulifera]
MAALSVKKPEIEEEKVSNGVTVIEKKFKNFDILPDVSSDHLYYWGRGGKRSNCSITPTSVAYKKIMKEWRILEKDLPDSIYVRAYENQINLLRAAIVGPAGTPYHDGLFFFDILFPSDYPFKPPIVTYHSFGLRINPNLYANGYVCLSLLSTWFSIRKGEGWNPNQSTIFQVLVSIQGMVLNRDPFFNEPGTGFILIPGQNKRSITYSENVFILSCKTMIYLLRRPPNDFDELVRSHFRDRASHILAACNAYMNGKQRICDYPAYNDDGSSSSSSSSRPVKKESRQFKEAVVKVYPSLLTAFTYAGDSVKSFVDEYKRENKERMSAIRVKKVDAETKKKKKMNKGFWNKIKGLFGLK